MIEVNHQLGDSVTNKIDRPTQICLPISSHLML